MPIGYAITIPVTVYPVRDAITIAVALAAVRASLAMAIITAYVYRCAARHWRLFVWDCVSDTAGQDARSGDDYDEYFHDIFWLIFKN